jgi:hypothetical protein
MANFYTSARSSDLIQTIGEARFAPYLRACRGDAATALDLYVWNLQAGASFYGPLAILEVTVRNALHRELAVLFGSTWHRSSAFQQMGQRVLQAKFPGANNERTDLLAQPAKLEAKLTLKHSRRSTRGYVFKGELTPTIDDIVAGLDFGYWTSLLNRDLEPVLYAAGLYKAFPRAPHEHGKRPARAIIAGKLTEIRWFRNRVMHHEPLFKRGNLKKDLQNIVEVCGWADCSAAEWIKHISTLDELLKNAPHIAPPP